MIRSDSHFNRLPSAVTLTFCDILGKSLAYHLEHK